MNIPLHLALPNNTLPLRWYTYINGMVNKPDPYLYDWLDINTSTYRHSLLNIRTCYDLTVQVCDVTSASNWDLSRHTEILPVAGNLRWTSDWDTSNIRTACNSLSYATGNIAHIANWDTGNLYTTSDMFYGSRAYGDAMVLTRWNTKKLIFASNMFYEANFIYNSYLALKKMITCDVK